MYRNCWFPAAPSARPTRTVSIRVVSTFLSVLLLAACNGVDASGVTGPDELAALPCETSYAKYAGTVLNDCHRTMIPGDYTMLLISDQKLWGRPIFGSEPQSWVEFFATAKRFTIDEEGWVTHFADGYVVIYPQCDEYEDSYDLWIDTGPIRVTYEAVSDGVNLMEGSDVFAHWKFVGHRVGVEGGWGHLQEGDRMKLEWRVEGGETLL